MDKGIQIQSGSRRLQPALERKHRLPLSSYKGVVLATFTLCIDNKRTLFTEKIIVDKFLEILNESKNKHDCKNWVYIFMPEHLHIILEGNSQKADLWKTIVLFKQKTGFWLSKNMKAIQWQKDFYDHIHRREDDLKKHILYILNNPVRKNIVRDWYEYPYKGSLDYNLDEVIS